MTRLPGLRERAAVALDPFTRALTPETMSALTTTVARFASQEIALAEARAEIGRPITLCEPGQVIPQRDSGDETRKP